MVTKRPRIKQIDEVVRRVFYEGETVRSRYHGLGEVTMTGEHPRVRFLDGRECRVPGDTVRLLPPEVYDAEVENQSAIERYLSFRVYGIVEPPTLSLPRPEFDLAAAMKRHAQTPPLPFVRPAPPSSAVLYFD